MANPAPTINQINAFNATQGTTIDFNIIGGTELIRSNRIYIYDLSDNSLICTHLYVSTESIHELPPNTDGSIVYESGKSSADFVNGAQYYAQIQTYTDTNGTQGGSGLSVAKMFWCLGDPTLTITTIPSTISTTSYNISATYTDTSASVVSNIIQQYQFNLYSATGSLLQSSGVVVGSGTQQGTSAVYDISHNFTGLNVGSSYYVTVDVITTQGMSVTTQSNTFTVSIDTPTLGEATVVNNACDGYISVTSNLSGEYGGSGSGGIVSFETDSENVFSKLQVDLEPTQEGSGNPSPSNVRPIRGHSGVDVNVGGKNLFNPVDKETPGTKLEVIGNAVRLTAKVDSTGTGTYLPVPTRILVIAGKTIFVSVGEIIKSKETLNAAVYVSVNDENGNRIGNFNDNRAYQLPTNAKSIDVYLYADAGSGTAKIGDYIEYRNVQVEYGTTATPYEPYQQPQTISQDFNVSLTPTTETAQAYTNPQIVSKYGTLEYVTNSIVPVGHKTTYLTRDIFGGYVDLISGKLVVTHGYVDLGTLSWSIGSTNTSGYNRFVSPDVPIEISQDASIAPNITSSQYVAQSPNDTYARRNGISNNINASQLIVYDETYATVSAAEFKTAMSGVQAVYPLATPQTYQLTPQQVNTLVGTNNVWSEQGNIELSYHIPITNLLVKRQDVDDVSGGWLTLYSQPITQASDMDFTFIDFLNQYGKTYKYALVPLLTQTQSGVEVEVEGGYTVSDEVQSVFDGVFIADSTGSQKCKANVGYGNVDMNQVVGSITPIGAKYPIIITNSHNQYHNGSISGTIVPDDYYFNGNLSRIDMVKKRNELEQFLTNKRVKVIKDWNGNIWLVMIVGNVSCTFNNNYGMGIVSFSTNWTEVGDPTNQQDLQATGLINVGGV